MGGGFKTQGAHGAPVANWVPVAVAFAVFLLGTLVYVLDRPGDSVPFLSAIRLGHRLPSVFGQIGENLPTFAHVFALSVLTAIWLGGRKGAGLLACLSWFGIDTAFEVGQHPQIAERLVQFIPGWFDRLPILAQADAYFLSGTFDVRDLISIVVGAAAAYLLIGCVAPRNIHRG
jgi:hypothetical protein